MKTYRLLTTGNNQPDLSIRTTSTDLIRKFIETHHDQANDFRLYTEASNHTTTSGAIHQQRATYQINLYGLTIYVFEKNYQTKRYTATQQEALIAMLEDLETEDTTSHE